MKQCDETVINWLLEDENPAIKYRTKSQLLGQYCDKGDVKNWIFDRLPANWFETNGLWYCYYITALAECGLSNEDVCREHFDKAFFELETMFDCSCGDFMLLTALVKLGFGNEKTIQSVIDSLVSVQLPDGGYLCLNRGSKLKYTPKSCYKANLHALMFVAECNKKGIKTNFGHSLIDYFLNRNLFYTSTDSTALVLNNREGWRTIDTFYPFEVMRVGLQNIVEAFSALGYGKDDRLQEAWRILNSCKNSDGKALLKGSLTKSYLPKESVGKPSKWVTFYTFLAEMEKENAIKI